MAILKLYQNIRALLALIWQTGLNGKEYLRASTAWSCSLTSSLYSNNSLIKFTQRLLTNCLGCPSPLGAKRLPSSRIPSSRLKVYGFALIPTWQSLLIDCGNLPSQKNSPLPHCFCISKAALANSSSLVPDL